MSRSISLDELVQTVQSRFQDDPPNGWQLGWDRERCLDLVRSAASPHPARNLTSFDDAFCNWYEVCIDPSDGKQHWKQRTLTIQFSFIAPVSCLYWDRPKRSTQGDLIASAPESYQAVEARVRAAVWAVGFFEAPSDWLNHEIEGIQLELSGTHHVTLGKCLFCDYDG